MLTFQPVTKDSMLATAHFLQHKLSRTCDYSVGAIYMWRNYYETSYAIFDDMLVFKVSYHDGSVSFTYPVGEKHMDQIIDALKEYCRFEGIPLVFCTVPKEAADVLRDRYHATIISEPDRDWMDYIYLTSNLANFPGRRFSGQRNHINKFLKLYPDYQYHTMTPDNVDRVKVFLKEYQELYGKSSVLAIEELTRALELLDYMFDFKLPGGFITVEDKIVCLAIGEIIDDTLYVHVEKAVRDYQGSYQMIVKEFTSHNTDENILYVNREEDVGDLGLRTSKLSYHPEALLEKYCMQIAL